MGLRPIVLREEQRWKRRWDRIPTVKKTLTGLVPAIMEEAIIRRASPFPSRYCPTYFPSPKPGCRVRTKSPLQADKILDAAAQLFGTQRFHEVRMEDIAAEAEVGKGTLYRYFRDKEELYLAPVTRALKQFHDRLEAVVRQGEEPLRRLVNVVAAILAFFDEQPHLFDLIQRAEVMRGADFPWRQTRDELVAWWSDSSTRRKRGGFLWSKMRSFRRSCSWAGCATYSASASSRGRRTCRSASSMIFSREQRGGGMRIERG